MNNGEKMFDIAFSHLNPRKFNRHAKSGDAVCVLMSKNGKYYIGQSLVATCGLGYCAEQAAISQMINEGETAIDCLAIVDKFGNKLTPCGRCCELMTQINENNCSTKIYLEDGKVVSLEDVYCIDWKRIKLLGNNKMNEDKFNLKRFLDAQKSNYLDAISELKNGRKVTHWMWYIFPQVSGLGRSETSEFFAIKSIEEAKAYMANPILRNRYDECVDAIMSQSYTAFEIFGVADALKLQSSLTMAYLATANDKYKEALNKFFGGEMCQKTLDFFTDHSK